MRRRRLEALARSRALALAPFLRTICYTVALPHSATQQATMPLRPGVDAARRLFDSGKLPEFRAMLARYDECVSACTRQPKRKCCTKLPQDDEWWRTQLPGLLAEEEVEFGAAELSRLMRWKLARGKWRSLQGMVEENSDKTVRAAVAAAFGAEAADTESLRTAVQALTGPLRGVGPATASALLAAKMPALAPFMSDEAMEGIRALGQRQYTLKHYLAFAEALRDRAAELGELNAEEVGRAMWVAAHVKALGLGDAASDSAAGGSLKKRQKIAGSAEQSTAAGG